LVLGIMEHQHVYSCPVEIPGVSIVQAVCKVCGDTKDIITFHGMEMDLLRRNRITSRRGQLARKKTLELTPSKV
jgi:hypothetical protein